MAQPYAERSVVLAASYPMREYRAQSDSHEIAAAVKALAGAVFQNGWSLVFGGHPTISPLILMIAREYDRKDRVIIYQSAYFANHIGPATRSLVSEHYGRMVLIPNVPSEPPPPAEEELDPTKCPRSLTLMRENMMQHPGITAIVLIGGDTGLQEELRLFAQKHKDRPMIPIGRPGGMAQDLVKERHVPGMHPETERTLKSSRDYMTLCSELMRYLSSDTRY
jgi:hypothetical protein